MIREVDGRTAVAWLRGEGPREQTARRAVVSALPRPAALLAAAALLAPVGAALGPAPAAAQQIVALGGGVVVPLAGFSDWFDTGAYGTVSVDRELRRQIEGGLDLGISAHSATHPFDVEESRATNIPLQEWRKEVLSAGVHAKVFRRIQQAPLIAYVQVGAGAYALITRTRDEFLGNPRERQIRPGVNGGAGLIYHVRPDLGLGLGAVVHNPFSERLSSPFFSVALSLYFVERGKG